MYSSSLIIPAGLNPGNYILRTEVIDLPKGDMTADDFTRGPHFYVNCMAVQVTSDGTDTPKGNKIPGIYNNMEEKFWVDGSVSANVATFKIPGPQVYTPSTPRGTT
ncbi:hypothetical protein EV174_001018 [Coemansia sp. RSA 2320]|nr:hypothetical protein EV174_001018 [Coemansia sp. RSA 2320]